MRVEDQSVLQRLLDRQHGGWMSDSRGGRTHVVAAALDSKPDVALLDIEMPGATGLEAAEQLGQAVRNHLSSVMQKLDARNRAEAVRLAEERGGSESPGAKRPVVPRLSRHH